eukprot:582294-Amphidinium_carterae.1
MSRRRHSFRTCVMLLDGGTTGEAPLSLGFFVRFDSCEFGDMYKVPRTWFTNMPQLRPLGMLCGGKHKHTDPASRPVPRRRYVSRLCHQLVEIAVDMCATCNCRRPDASLTSQ